MNQRWVISGLGTVGAIVALVVAATSMASSGEDPAARSISRAPNPHWHAQGCVICHGQEGEPSAIEPAGVTRLCIRCHDGVRAPAEVHPVGRTFDDDQILLPEGWPAPDGKLSCLTCHDVLMACDRERTRPEVNPAFLRDFTSHNPLDHCARCHVAAAETKGQRYNPHRMLDEAGRPIAQACAFCHSPDLDVQAAARRLDREGLPALRADGISLCVGCHRTHKDYFNPGHIGLTVSADFVADMAVRRPPVSGGGTGEPPATRPALIGKTLLPLEHGRRIVCATCHNPHQQGVFPPSSVLGAGAMLIPDAPRGAAHPTIDGNERLRRRGLGPNVCLGCHDK